MAEESVGTVLVAGTANLAIAVAKTVGGLLSGSSAMLAEAAHSVADTLNQVFLLTALKRSKKPADAQHPFGHGMERYFWSLLAAVGIFVLGAGFSIFEGVRAILEPEQELTSLLVTYGVLGISFILEGISWLRVFRQLRREGTRRQRSTLEHVRKSPDPTTKTVVFEDTAALIGLVLAALGVTLHKLTGEGFWDAAASIAIGILLVGVAYALGRENKSTLIGQAVTEETRAGIRAVIAQSPGVNEVVDLMTLQLGPDDVLVTARVDMDDSARGDTLERYADGVESRLRTQFPEVRHVFLDPTSPRGHATNARGTR
jgi:cation diffusion facilitator family transporter